MIEIRYIQANDNNFWDYIEKHFPLKGYDKKEHNIEGYVLLNDNEPIGILRFDLVWDSIPLCTMVVVDEKFQGQNFETMLMQHWESNMKTQGYHILLMSTHPEDGILHIYKEQGYKECECLNGTIRKHTTELFLIKDNI